MDRLDKKLLNLLQTDASRTNSQLADEVGLSPSTCLRRVARLKAGGFIDRIVAILNSARIGQGLKAFVTVELDRHGEQFTRQFLEEAAAETIVTQAYSVSGQTDVILMLRMSNMAEYEELCGRLFREGTNVVRYYTYFVKRTGKDTTAMQLT